MAERHEKQYDESFKNPRVPGQVRKWGKRRDISQQKLMTRRPTRSQYLQSGKPEDFLSRKESTLLARRLDTWLVIVLNLAKDQNHLVDPKHKHAVGATMEGTSSDKLTVDKLEKVLADRKQEEISLLTSTQSTTNVAQATGTNNLTEGS